MSWLSRVFASMFQRSSRQDQLAAYVIREHGQGRDIHEILEDPYLRNRTTDTELRQLLEHPDVIRAVGEQLRTEDTPPS